jgi:hypothetical protein
MFCGDSSVVTCVVLVALALADGAGLGEVAGVPPPPQADTTAATDDAEARARLRAKRTARTVIATERNWRLEAVHATARSTSRSPAREAAKPDGAAAAPAAGAGP